MCTALIDRINKNWRENSLHEAADAFTLLVELNAVGCNDANLNDRVTQLTSTILDDMKTRMEREVDKMFKVDVLQRIGSINHWRAYSRQLKGFGEKLREAEKVENVSKIFDATSSNFYFNVMPCMIDDIFQLGFDQILRGF
jgi:hypothetical protein